MGSLGIGKLFVYKLHLQKLQQNVAKNYGKWCKIAKVISPLDTLESGDTNVGGELVN